MWNILFLLTVSRVVSSAYVANSISQSDAQSSSVVHTNAEASGYSSAVLQGSLSTVPRGPCHDASVELLTSAVDPCGRPVAAIPVSVPVSRPAVRFGFDVLQPPGPYHRPNCGCVPRGGCSGEVGLYTSQVIHRSDLVCGLRFETCCYDGPFPGVADEFSRAAACIPQEQCVRPYGILPTDVRDFGVIAPCPGHGAVRCLIVDNQGLLEFKAALASIEASTHQRIVQTDSAEIAPIHIDVPIQTAVNTGVSSFTSSSALTPMNPLPPVVNNAVTTGTYVSSGAAHAVATSVPVTPFVPEPVPAPVPVPAPAPVPAPYYGQPAGHFGFGYPGLGLGFRKHFSFSKNYGFGLFK